MCIRDREYADRYFDDESVRQMYENHQVSAEAQDAYRDAGFPFMGLPEEVGGIPTDHVTLGLMTEKLYEFTGAMTPFMTGMLACADLAEFGTPEQSAVIMEEYEKSGQSVAALCLSEPAAGSDNMGMTMTSKKQADGTYVLNGQKTWVTNGADVPYFIVICKDEEPARENNKMSLWLVKRETEGVSTAHLTKLGQHTVPFVDVFFDNVVVEESQRIGEAGAGWLLLMKNFEFERCLVVAQGLGLAQAAQNDAIAYAKERIAFGKPIITNPRVQGLIEQNEIMLQQTRHWLYYCLWKLDQGQSINADIAMLKSWGTRAHLQIADNAIEVYGTDTAASVILRKFVLVAFGVTFVVICSLAVRVRLWTTSPVVSWLRSTRQSSPPLHLHSFRKATPIWGRFFLRLCTVYLVSFPLS